MKERFGHLLGHMAAVGHTLSHRLALGHCSLATAGGGVVLAFLREEGSDQPRGAVCCSAGTACPSPTHTLGVRASRELQKQFSDEHPKVGR